MTRQRKILVWTAMVVAGLLACVALTVLVVRDLDTADKLAGVVGALVGAAGLGVSLRALSRGAPGPDPAGPVVTAEGERSVAAGGSVSGTVVTGDGRSTGPLPPPRSPRPTGRARPDSGPPAEVRTPGARSVGAGGDISGNVVTGDQEP
ncbi:hypothetical protein [Streptomyces fradiae]|uniref:hypothetical protein n=1 Tax=Streptomyces fradiae TaxID=1906 RepID=UPI002943BC7D|nr:hypothetical protein [Streptomyces fradiae]WOI61696.1 hypothetical protein RYQ63_18325 [Streptomyces fradiae]